MNFYKNLENKLNDYVWKTLFTHEARVFGSMANSDVYSGPDYYLANANGEALNDKYEVTNVPSEMIEVSMFDDLGENQAISLWELTNIDDISSELRNCIDDLTDLYCYEYDPETFFDEEPEGFEDTDEGPDEDGNYPWVQPSEYYKFETSEILSNLFYRDALSMLGVY